MKKILWLLLVLLLLSGCGKTEEKTTIPTQETQSTTVEAEPPKQDWMELRQPVGELQNTWYVPNEAVETMQYPEMILWQDSLLLYSNWFTSAGENTCVIKRIRLNDGALMAETSFSGGCFITVQTSRDKIGICDGENGIVRIFDEELKQTNSYQFSRASDDWYLGSDLKRLYHVNWEKGISCTELETGETVELLTDVQELYVRNYAQSYLVVTYLDLKTQIQCSRLLDLNTGALEELPVNGNVMTAVRVDDTWLLSGTNWWEYQILSDGIMKNAAWLENRFELLAPKAHILTAGASGTVFNLYDTQGHFLSQCVLPNEQMYAGRNFIWSQEQGGYFFLVFEDGEKGKLLFWDTSVPVTGEDFYLYDDSEPSERNVDPKLYDRAGKIGAQYGVVIHIADQCQVDYTNFDASQVFDNAWINRGLDLLEQSLSSYPEGFFGQLSYGSIQSLQFELVGGLAPHADASLGANVAAFAQERQDYNLIVLDVFALNARNIYHEIAHVIDRRLWWDTAIRENALFREDTWMTLNPEGFHYAYSYEEIPAEVTQYGNTGCFESDYGMTFPTEDRATIMAAAMSGDYLDRTYWAGLLDKLDYYSRCIRECMDTTGWPEKTTWEQPI